MSAWSKAFRALRGPLIGIVVALIAASGLLVALGESPKVLLDAIRSTLFTQFGLGYTLFYATPLIFTGLAVAIPFHCGLFNIGAEGQLHLGAVAIIVTGACLPRVPSVVAVPLGILAAAVAGGLWGGFAGFLKAKRGSHEVIVTILLNFIATIFVDYLILYPYHDPSLQAPESVTVPDAFHLAKLETVAAKLGFELFKSTPVNISLFLAVACAVLVHAFLFYTAQGFELRTVGRNPIAARFAGIPVASKLSLSLFLGGALAGLVGVNEVMGYHHSLIEGFSPGYGFTGIAVALLARNHPIGILLTALLFGGLQNSARELEFLSERVSKELSLVLQGGLIAITACDYYLTKWLDRLSERKKQAGASHA